jgi:flagellar motility protein MotE (MotC chaperone)
MKSFRDIRVIPVVLVAIFGLMVLKIAGLVLDGGYVFDYQPSVSAKPATMPAPAQVAKQASWAQDTLNFPGGRKGDPADITGSAPAPKEPPKPAAPATEPAKPDGVVMFPDQTPRVSESERAVLERLQARRQELDQRAREIEIRESLLKAAEKRIESKVEEMKALEGNAATAAGQRNEQEAARFKGIVTMYEGMKPKDAAKVFDRLEMSVLIEIASQIAPRKMSDIMGVMQPEAAERLTVELARRAGGGDKNQAELPKIEGKMLNQKIN